MQRRPRQLANPSRQPSRDASPAGLTASLAQGIRAKGRAEGEAKVLRKHVTLKFGEPSPDVLGRMWAPRPGFDLPWRFKGKWLRVGAVLGKEFVGLLQADDDEWELFYGPLLIGYVLRRDGTYRIEPPD